MSKQQYSFPLLKNKEILLCLKELQIPFTEEDQKNPTAEKLKEVSEIFVEKMMGIYKDDARKAPFSAIEVLPFPELHEQGIPEMTLYKSMLKLMSTVGLHDCTLQQLVCPDAASTKRILSALINFAKFREERLAIYQEYTARTEELMEIRATLEGENTTLSVEVQNLRATRKQVEPLIQSLEDDIAALSDQMSKLHKESGGLRDDIKATKEAMNDYNDKIANDKFLLLNATRENERLKMQIVRSPDKLKSRLARMEQEIAEKKGEVEDFNGKLRELQSAALMLHKVDGKLAKRMACLKACLEDRKKSKELHNEIKTRSAACSSEEDRAHELAAAAQHLEKQFSQSQEKLFQLQKQGEQKRVAAQQALDEAERRKIELGYSIQQDKVQLAANQAIIQRKQQEVEWLAEGHKREMEQLRKHYARFAQDIANYHATVSHAIVSG